MSINTKFANAQNYFPPATFAPGTVVVCRGERAVVRNTVRRLGSSHGGEWTVVRRERDGRILNCRPANLQHVDVDPCDVNRDSRDGRDI